MTFHIGQRVICASMNTAPYSPAITLVGYFGHVNYVAAIENYTDHIVGVDLVGLTAQARARDEANGEDVDDFLRQAMLKPWPFFEHELIAAD